METSHSMMVRHGLLLLLFTLEKILKREVSGMGIFLQVGVVTGQKVGGWEEIKLISILAHGWPLLG